MQAFVCRVVNSDKHFNSTNQSKAAHSFGFRIRLKAIPGKEEIGMSITRHGLSTGINRVGDEFFLFDKTRVIL